ncbi:MAG: DUF47 family protein [Candidatus Micrarchaeota archaeon]
MKARMVKVLDFLLPKEEKFYDMLFKQTETSVRAGRELEDLVRHYNTMPADERLKRINRIRELEHEGDEETHAIIDRLHTTFITPLDREDIHELAILLDDQIDFIDNVGKKLAVFHVRKLPEVFLRQVEVAMRSVHQVHEAIRLLRHPQKVKQYLVKIHDLEDEADKVYAEAIQSLFQDGADPLEVIKFKDIYETAEAISDNCQAVSVLIEGIVVKNA